MVKRDAVDEWVQVATPSDPAANYSKPYFKSDGKLYGKTGSTETLIGPGASGGPSATSAVRWTSNVSYVTGDIVGYAGKEWRAGSNNLNKPPSLYTSIWTPYVGVDAYDWEAYDPYFLGDTLGVAWDTFWKTGSSTVSLTTTVGEFETGKQACKVTLSVSSSQRLFERSENIVRGGELIRAEVRAKITSVIPDVTLLGQLLQNDATSDPVPLATGLSVTAASEGPQTLTTEWKTFNFTFTAVNGKPRAIVNITPQTTSTGGAFVVIDRIIVTRSPLVFIDTMDWGNYHPEGAANLGSLSGTAAKLTFNAAQFRGAGVMADGANGLKVTKAGIYKLQCDITVNGTGVGWIILELRIYRGGSQWRLFNVVGHITTSGAFNEMTVHGISDMLPGDIAYVYATAMTTGNQVDSRSSFSIHQLSTSGASNGELTAGYRGTTAQSIPNATLATVDLSATPDHTCGGISIASNIVTIQTAGVYQLQGSVTYNLMAQARVLLRIEGWSGSDPAVGSGTILAGSDISNLVSNYPGLQCVGQAFLPAGYRLRLITYQSSGGAAPFVPGTEPAKLNIRKVSQGGLPNDTGWLLPGAGGGSFGAGWGHFAGGYEQFAVKRVGNTVTGHGMISRTSGSGNILVVLPVGMWPTRATVRLSRQNAQPDSVFIDNTNGNINASMSFGYTNTQPYLLDFTFDINQP